MEMTKQIVEAGKISNLVGMYAAIWDGGKLVGTMYILGKADDTHYIVQCISALTGEPNVARIVKIDDMRQWHIYETKEILEFCLGDYYDTKINRYNPFF